LVQILLIAVTETGFLTSNPLNLGTLMGVQMCLYLKNCHDIRTESVIMLTLNYTLHTIIDARVMAHCN
jgi:protein-arginine kinase